LNTSGGGSGVGVCVSVDVGDSACDGKWQRHTPSQALSPTSTPTPTPPLYHQFDLQLHLNTTNENIH